MRSSGVRSSCATKSCRTESVAKPSTAAEDHVNRSGRQNWKNVMVTCRVAGHSSKNASRRRRPGTRVAGQVRVDAHKKRASRCSSSMGDADVRRNIFTPTMVRRKSPRWHPPEEGRSRSRRTVTPLSWVNLDDCFRRRVVRTSAAGRPSWEPQ